MNFFILKDITVERKNIHNFLKSFEILCKILGEKGIGVYFYNGKGIIISDKYGEDKLKIVSLNGSVPENAFSFCNLSEWNLFFKELPEKDKKDFFGC